MDANEARVREVWEKVHTGQVALHLSAYSSPIVIRNGGEFANWSAAAAYTETVLEEARQLREAIDELWKLPKRAWVQYTLARLEAIYAAHIRGIKPDALCAAKEQE